MQHTKHFTTKARSFIPAVIFVLIFAAGSTSAYLVLKSEQKQAQLTLSAEAENVASLIATRIDQHTALLRASKAFLKISSAGISGSFFTDLMDQLSLESTFPSVQGIGLAPFIRKADNSHLSNIVWPASSELYSTPVQVLVPADARNNAALNYDMYSEPTRRLAIKRALQTGELSMTAPVTLKQEITENIQPGVLAYLPIFSGKDGSSEEHQGFVYAAYRTVDLHKEAIGAELSKTVLIATYDAEVPDQPLFKTAGFDNEADSNLFTGLAKLSIGGREWIVEAQHKPAIWYARAETKFLLMVCLSFVIATLVSFLTYQQFRYAQKAQENRTLSQKNLKLKELHFREMKHRLKNSIARILAIARQTEISASTTSEFNSIFFDRLNAMAQAQELLSRSNDESLSLELLISKELKQATTGTEVARSLSGDLVYVGEDNAANMGLVFHELATNALKYGCFACEGGQLDVQWNYSQENVIISWVEKNHEELDKEMSSGFGTVLINSLVQSELGGEVQRSISGRQFHVRLVIPAKRDKGSDYAII